MDSTARGALAKVPAVTLGRWLIKILAKLIPQRRASIRSGDRSRPEPFSVHEA